MENFGVINYTTYLLGTIFIVLLPGPNSLYVLTLAVQQSKKHGWAGAMGVFVGDYMLILFTALGAATLLSTNPNLFIGLKVIGALYLAYLGLCLVYGGWKNWHKSNSTNNNTKNDSNTEVLPPIKVSKSFRKALMVSLLNPKAILFFLSFFVQFIDPHYTPVAVPLLVLSMTLQTISIAYLSVLIYAGDKLANAFKKQYKISAIANAVVGVGFMAFAVKLALASA